MNEQSGSLQKALRYDVEIKDDGLLKLHVPFHSGSRVSVFVIEESVDTFNELSQAAQSSIDFWDNSFDDEDWNNA